MDHSSLLAILILKATRWSMIPIALLAGTIRMAAESGETGSSDAPPAAEAAETVAPAPEPEIVETRH
jgi:hypothetical protein